MTEAPAIFLPGLICDDRVFDGVKAAFPDGWFVPGYGEADRLGTMADGVIARMPRRVRLVGHSMGGRVALEIVRRVPERVADLALLSTGVHTVRPGEAEKRHRLRDLGRTAGMAALVDAWLPPMLASARRTDAALLDAARTMCVDAGLSTYERHVAALLSRPEVESLLPRITCPVLLAVGSDDAWSPPAQHRMMREFLVGSELAVVEGAGHMLPMEEAGHLCRLLNEFHRNGRLNDQR